MTKSEFEILINSGEEAFNRRKNIYELWSIKK